MPSSRSLTGPQLRLVETVCAICGPGVQSTELYAANFDLDDLNRDVFSARRLPDRVHYRLVRCDRCLLVRSDPVTDAETLGRLYGDSTFDYGDELTNLRSTYGRYLDKLGSYGAGKDSLLEIGCGNGFFLEEALAHGYRRVQGVEPSIAAANQARPDIGQSIIRDVLRPGVLQPEQFDVVCLFQVFDHMTDPGLVLDECRRALKPGGLMLCLNHNVSALSARLLGERSPIVDIEHTYLYNPQTITSIFTAHGFEVLRVGPVRNQYSLSYLSQLVPLPKSLKDHLLAWLRNNRAGRLRLSVPLGNLYAVGRRGTSGGRDGA
jgi:SAM-dependent methyltransferase